MRPNLSVEKIAGALAVLGTSVLMAACGGDKPANTPVNATETPTAGDMKPAEGHCGAGKEHKAGEASCGAAGKEAAKPADATPAMTTPAAATPATTPAADPAKTATDTKAAAGSATDAKDPKKVDAKKPAAPAAPAKKGGGASCGAGTCSAKK